MVAIANDITYNSGSFGPREDAVFHAVTMYALEQRLPLVYLAANSGARVGLASEIKACLQVPPPHNGWNLQPSCGQLSTRPAVAGRVPAAAAVAPSVASNLVIGCQVVLEDTVHGATCCMLWSLCLRLAMCHTIEQTCIAQQPAVAMPACWRMADGSVVATGLP